MSTQMRNLPVKNKLILLLIGLAILIGIGYPIFEKKYVDPIVWKKNQGKALKEKKPYLNDSLVSQYSDCLYELFSEKYGSIDNFPKQKKLHIRR